ncbi:MAG TPA: hypothetical protein VIM73_13850 [Polyangiaceae bacterium]
MARGKPSWAITKVAATGTIWLRFTGPTLTAEVPDFIAALNEMMPEEDANVVFDLRRLVGHNPETKEPIKAWLRDNKPRIGQITVLVPKSGTILKMVTAVIALATGVKIQIREDMDESVSAAQL